MVGIDAKQLLLNDLAVNPVSGNVYISASRGKGPDAAPLLFRVDRASKIEMRAEDLVKRAIDKLHIAEARIQAAEIDRRAAEAGMFA